MDLSVVTLSPVSFYGNYLMIKLEISSASTVDSKFKCHISTRNGGSLKLVDKITYLGSNVSSTENDINTQLTKA